MARGANLTGVWHGLFSYPRVMEPAHFMATLISHGPHFSGTSQENSANWRGQMAQRNADIVGTVDADIVTFLKTYHTETAMLHKQAISYSGLLSEDHSEIEGIWTIPGAWSGKFLMMRNRHPDLALARKKFAET